MRKIDMRWLLSLRGLLLLIALCLCIDIVRTSCRDSLHTACVLGEYEKVVSLVERGWDVNKMVADESPLHLAAKEGHAKIVAFLISNGADLNAIDYDDATPLYRAIVEEHIDCAEILIEADADTNAGTFWNYTPLHSAAYRGNERLAALLISHGADVNCSTTDGETPLYTALREGHLAVARILVKHGANLFTEQKPDRTTPIGRLSEEEREELAKTVERLKAEVLEPVSD